MTTRLALGLGGGILVWILLSGRACILLAGRTKVNPKDGLTYVYIPPGRFVMGCSPGDTECNDDEKPAHEVIITKGFWIGQTEVTQAAFQRWAGSNPSYFKGGGDRWPVESVSQGRATRYCLEVGMRLPTEAEWEYAARAGSTASRYGDLDAIAWYDGNSGGHTHEVGQKQPNAWGLYDMLGNVTEWTNDSYDKDYYRQSPWRDPQGPSEGPPVSRGGSWSRDEVPRVSYRSGGDLRSNAWGFRCAGGMP